MRAKYGHYEGIKDCVSMAIDIVIKSKSWGKDMKKVCENPAALVATIQECSRKVERMESLDSFWWLEAVFFTELVQKVPVSRHYG
jgi:hypothetical protein